MTWYGIWYGGASYAVPEIPRDLERFDSLEEARRALESRRDPSNREYPVVGHDSEIWLWRNPPSEDQDVYPERIVRFGARGGIIVEEA